MDKALGSAEAENWIKAMETEMETLAKMGTWTMEDLPEGRDPIGCKWVYDIKCNEHSNVICYKVCLVVQGFLQKLGTDYSNDGTFAPVMCFKSLQTLIVLGAINN